MSSTVTAFQAGTLNTAATDVSFRGPSKGIRGWLGTGDALYRTAKEVALATKFINESLSTFGREISASLAEVASVSETAARATVFLRLPTLWVSVKESIDDLRAGRTARNIKQLAHDTFDALSGTGYSIGMTLGAFVKTSPLAAPFFQVGSVCGGSADVVAAKLAIEDLDLVNLALETETINAKTQKMLQNTKRAQQLKVAKEVTSAALVLIACISFAVGAPVCCSLTILTIALASNSLAIANKVYQNAVPCLKIKEDIRAHVHPSLA